MNIIAHTLRASSDRRVLIIDDHPVVAEGWGRIIRDQMPCEIISAGTTLAGWKAWREHRPDMIVADLSFGGNKVAGLKLIERLRRADGHVPILVFTMHSSAILARRALRTGAQGVINKDAPSDEICQAFVEVMAGRHYMDTRFAQQIALMEMRSSGSASATLTHREEEILGMLAEGLSYQLISERACISYKTVSNVALTLKTKLGARNLTDLVVKGIQYFEAV
ncbi:response regulator transcription factor [Breoghania sp.]|uniref:response regulator transcription factor n=1 Tax=Breoghania sp. TaxID=2065378 RepID=UPI0029C9FC75|nr:response regulator transcription factor [Breoghania sp.]